MGFAKRCLTRIGWIFEHTPNTGTIPPGFSSWARNSGCGQTSLHFADAQSLAPDPVEDLADHLRLLVDDLLTRLTATLDEGDIAVTLRCTAEHVRRALLGLVTLAPAAALQHLGPFIFPKSSPAPEAVARPPEIDRVRD